MQALLKAKKRWASGQLELEHPSFHDNDPNASGHASSNYEKNAKVNTCTLNSSELNAATERKLSLLSHTSLEHLANEQDDTTYVLVDTNIWKNLLSTVKCPKCDMNALNIIKTTQLGMASKLELVCSSCEAVLNSSFSSARVKEKNFLTLTKKMVSSFLRLGKGHAGLELFALVTGLVIDYEILSKYCTECTAAVRDLSGDSPDFAIWYEGHKSECQINHTGSSSSMEMEAAAILWQRAINECNMRYTCILSDGDSKTFQHLMSLNIYGKGKPIKKRKAIKDNCNNVEKMKSAIEATLYHCSSTDAKPKHNKCPNGKLSWCFFKRALAKEKSPESHSVMKTKLTEEAVAKIRPVYQRLASNEILSRCTSGKNQNANVSLHSVIWSHCPKKKVSNQRIDWKYLL
ncbi:uncharacterized protein TNCV_4171941 [Trichonephila clavipes]|nr:uncharacterized protein TNCV_4171941 [Trichonephila clavipes]